MDLQNWNVIDKMFDDEIELLPSVTELFELQLAYLEYNTLPIADFYERSAYFKSRKGKLTKHFSLYSNVTEALIDERSNETKQYFEQGNFSTGYATHGLFPYRGKFHPQLIKALLNIIGIKKSETILDPMCGSGTLNIEAALNGINSYATDVSPFCRFMTKVKYDSLTLNSVDISNILTKKDDIFDMFSNPEGLSRLRNITDPIKRKVGELCLLAYLDALGYSKRVKMNDHKTLFRKVLSRYVGVLQDSITKIVPNISLGNVKILDDSTAQKLDLPDNSIDGIITSPPYSFAIDYAENDAPHIEYLGYSVAQIRNNMIGLKGKSIQDKLESYFTDMNSVVREASRVLKPDKTMVIIIGSNTNQTKGVRLEDNIIIACGTVGLNLYLTINKPIKGMRNTMKEELILFFKKE